MSEVPAGETSAEGRELKELILEYMDTLDSGVLAPEWVLDLDQSEKAEAFRAGSTDLQEAERHYFVVEAGESSACPVDNQVIPCERVARLLAKYRQMKTAGLLMLPLLR